MPERLAYIQGAGKTDELPVLRDPGACPTRTALIVHRGDAAYVVLNLYPYNSGHLMVVPFRHVADYTELTDAETAEVAALTQTAMRVLRAGQRRAGLQPRDEPGCRSLAQASPRTCTSTSYRDGVATPTSCRSSRAPRCCRSCCATPASCSPTPGPASPTDPKPQTSMIVVALVDLARVALMARARLVASGAVR